MTLPAFHQLFLLVVVHLTELNYELNCNTDLFISGKNTVDKGSEPSMVSGINWGLMGCTPPNKNYTPNQ